MHKLLNSCLLFFMAFQLIGQSTEVPLATECFFIKDAEVVVKPGQIISGASIIIRNGLISDLGVGLQKPYDAQQIDADSLYVYAGFIDPLSYTGLKEEEKDSKTKEDKPKSPGVATFSQAGITPQALASEMLSVKDKSIESMRNSGFVISHVIPKSAILAGQGSILSLKETDVNEEMILRKDISMLCELKAKRGVFPSTLIGAMSRLREIKKNTDIYLKNNAQYKANPVGMSRPSFVPEYAAFSDVVSKTKPLFFIASKPKEIHRAITLHKELDYNMVLADVKLISPIIDILKPNTPILLNLHLPKEVKDDSKKEAKKDTLADGTKKLDTLSSTKKTNPEQERLLAKKKESYNLYMSQAKILAERNIPFSFSYLDISASDILKSIRRLIEAGLPENKALEALTTSPAQILNISNIAGTIEKGKLGSLVITKKPLFDEKSTIKYVFVEGQLTTMKEKDPKKAKSVGETKSDLSGTWRYEISIEDATQYGNIFMQKNGDSYDIKVEDDNSPGDSDEAYNVVVDGNDISFNIMVEGGDAPMEVETSISFTNGLNFEGNAIITGFGTFKITGVKRDTPD